MKIRAGVFGFLLGLAVLAVSPPVLYGEEKLHTVQKGETFFSIGRVFGIKADDLMKYNGISDPGRLQAGQRLKIPGAGGGTVSPARGSAAQAVPESVLSARAADPKPAGNAGGASSGGGEAASYRVVRGDTFYSIARKYSVSVAAIQEANSLPGNYILRAGDSLKIPSRPAIGGTAQSQAAVETRPQVRTDPRETESRTVNSSVRWPVTVRELNYMTGKLSGVVITGTRAESVKSLIRGTVLSAGPYRGFGKVAIIQVEGGYLYVYGGCESLLVKEGDKVDPGTEIGKLGIDAVTNKPQLFFMVYRSNAPMDPAKAPRA